MSAKCIGIYRPPFRVQSGGAIQFSPSPNRSAPQWSATRKVPLVDFWRKSWIDVAKSASHQLSQSEIASDKPCYQHLPERQCPVNALVFSDYKAAPIRRAILQGRVSSERRDGLTPHWLSHRIVTC